MEDRLKVEITKQCGEVLDMERLFNAARTQTDYGVVLDIACRMIDGPYDLSSAIADFDDYVAEPGEIFHLGIC